MIVNFLYILMAIFGVSFLIFIHELGHYYMARRTGMRVEVFSIGFGQPIASWERDGVKWQIGWLPFGGYVKIAGADLDQVKDPYTVPDGFFGKPPIDRIKVAFMGPLANLLFAIIAFSLLWASGGRSKHFAEYTHKIGWVDPHSVLYAMGVRPGDEISAYNQQPYQGSKDHLYTPMTIESDKITVHGYKVNYATKEKTPFSYETNIYPHPEALEKGIVTAGILAPASYILYNRLPNGEENPLPKGSPLSNSGLTYGDRIVWVNGELIVSLQQLNYLLAGKSALLTIQRDGHTQLARVPRVLIQELKLPQNFREELTDWQFESQLQNGVGKLQNQFMIPYAVTNGAVIEERLKFIDKEKESIEFPPSPYSDLDLPLLPGDKILAVNGIPIQQAYQLLEQLQVFRVNVIIERQSKSSPHLVTASKEDAAFDAEIHWDALQEIAQSLGTPNTVTRRDNYILLQPITPKVQSAIILPVEKQAQWATEVEEHKKVINSIEDPEKRHRALEAIEQQERRLMLGLPGIQDRDVLYNPNPFTLWYNVLQDIWKTLTALVSGALNPKWLAGPIGIVQIVHNTSMHSMKEALYWLGLISLNLGILNLLPIPMLDGGTILMTLFELVSRKKLPPKTLEKLILPFTFIFIAFFIYVTYNDILRLFTKFY
jgi:regulator of sigma E protease